MISVVRRHPTAVADSEFEALRTTLEMMRSEHERLRKRAALERQRAAELRQSAAQICAEIKALREGSSPASSDYRAGK